MITLTNEQILAIASPGINSLFTDPARQFSVYDGFKFLEVMAMIKPKVELYNEAVNTIISNNGGTHNGPNTKVEYPSEEQKENAIKSIKELLSIPVEIQVNKLKISDAWPKLTLTELTILKPLLEV